MLQIDPRVGDMHPCRSAPAVVQHSSPTSGKLNDSPCGVNVNTPFDIGFLVVFGSHGPALRHRSCGTVGFRVFRVVRCWC